LQASAAPDDSAPLPADTLPPRHCPFTPADTAALDAEDAVTPPARPRHRRSFSSSDARALAKVRTRVRVR